MRLHRTMNILFGCVLGMSAVLLFSCGGENGSSGTHKDTTVTSDTSQESVDVKEISDMLNEAMARLRYGDKSVLYDNEFEYFTDEVSYDEYLARAEVRWAQADSITFIDVRDVQFFDHDSALVTLTVNMEGPTGKKSYIDDKVVVYYFKGRWIKPTVTVIDLQLDYEEKIRVADSVAAAEATEEASGR